MDLATMAGAGEVLAEIEDVSPPPTIGGAVPNSQHGERASPLCGRWAGAWLAVVSLLAVAVYWLIKYSLIDDSYITLGYARNLAVHFHWGLIPQETANSATSPLNVLLLAALMDLLRISGGVHEGLAVGVLFVACMLAVGWAWLRIGRALRLPLWVPVFGALLVLVNPFVLSASQSARGDQSGSGSWVGSPWWSGPTSSSSWCVSRWDRRRSAGSWAAPH